MGLDAFISQQFIVYEEKRFGETGVIFLTFKAMSWRAAIVSLLNQSHKPNIGLGRDPIGSSQCFLFLWVVLHIPHSSGDLNTQSPEFPMMRKTLMIFNQNSSSSFVIENN